MSDVKYIHNEPAAYPADHEWVIMTPDERGCYHSLIAYCGCEKDGKLPEDIEKLAKLCNAKKENFENFWDHYRHKFKQKNNMIWHKRVLLEIKKARNYIKQRKLAGIKSGQARRTVVERSFNKKMNETPTKERKGKVSKEKVIKEEEKENKEKKKFIPPTLEEVQKYLHENPKYNNVDPGVFWDYFNSSGWIDSEGKPVKNWKQKLITWNSHDNNRTTATGRGQQQKPSGGQIARDNEADYAGKDDPLPIFGGEESSD